MIRRGKGICAVLLLIGASGAGVGVALAVGTAAASGDAGSWRATAQQAAWHAHGGQTSSGQATSQPTRSPQPSSPAPTASPFQGAAGQGGGRHGHSSGNWGGNGNHGSWGNAGQGSQGSQGSGSSSAVTTTTTTSTTPTGGQGGGGGGGGERSHQGTGSHGVTPPATTIISHQGGGGGQQGGGGTQSGHATLGGQGSRAGRQPFTSITPPEIASIKSGQPPATVTTSPTPSSPSPSPAAPNPPPAPNPPRSPTTNHGSSTTPGSNLPSDIAGLLGTTHVATPAPVTNGLGAALGLTPARALSAAAATPLLAAVTGPTTGATTGTRGSAAQHGHSAGHRSTGSGSSLPSPGRVITDIERVVPGWVWLALALALALATAAGTAAFVATRRVKRQAGQFAAVTAAALTDPLTGVLNRRGFIEALERELARARRYNLRFVLAYVDVRNLKGVNDTEGHLAGDELLKDAAHLLKDSARADDVVGRIGGDEMGLLLVEQGAEGADVVINRITSQIPERQEALGLRAPWDLTVGTSSFPDDGSTVTELLATADRRLYEQRGIALH
jgi:diguanylate cyclase (GGDEF)-like protein